jgi:hypothetical protein
MQHVLNRSALVRGFDKKNDSLMVGAGRDDAGGMWNDGCRNVGVVSLMSGGDANVAATVDAKA